MDSWMSLKWVVERGNTGTNKEHKEISYSSETGAYNHINSSILKSNNTYYVLKIQIQHNMVLVYVEFGF